ncbi:MAG: gliding motility-associated C-terminal domain-containing protein [Bacteroidota bacterium]|nr:gliding motility-associated C-terminal domain-containing protein [Bacteroidota bacterium]
MTKTFTPLLFLLTFFTLSAVRLNAQSVGGITTGAAVYCSGINSGFLSLSGHTGTILTWESSNDGGLTWTSTGTTVTSQSYFNLTISTCYRAIVQSGAFPPDTSTISCITVYLPSNGGSISGGGTFCVSAPADSLLLSGINGNVLYWQFSTDGGSSWTTISDTTTSLPYSPITSNTLYWAVVQNGPMCPTDTSSQSTFIINSPSAGGMVNADDTVCYLSNAGTLNLSGHNGSVTGWVQSTNGGITWTPVSNTSTSQTYSGLLQTTLFAAVVQNGVCPTDTSAFSTIDVLTPPIVSAGSDTTLLPGASVTLNGSGSGTPSWSPTTGLDNPMLFNPVATPSITTNYMLTVTDGNGCMNTDAVLITVILPEFSGVVTTLFTPNGDGINEFWFIPEILNYPDNEVIVFNIYGQQVYSQKEYKNDWAGTYNGKPLPDGTYYFVLRFTENEKVLKGSLDILRNK